MKKFKYIKSINEHSNQKLDLCRIIKAENISDIDFDNLGIHWTPTPEKAVLKINPDNEPSFWIYAIVDKSSIWDDYTPDDVKHHPGLETNQEIGEFEVTLRPGSVVDVTEVYDEDQNLVMGDFKAKV